MADKLYKVNEAIEIGYQAPNKETGLTIITEIYLPNKSKDSNYPNVTLDEVGTTGTYRGSFTPNQEGTWQVITYKDGGDGQVTKSYSVGAKNIQDIYVDTAKDTTVAKDATVAKDSSVAKAADLAIVGGKVNEIDSEVDDLTIQVGDVKVKTDALPADPASESNVAAAETNIRSDIAALDTKVSSLDTPPMAF